MFGAYVVKYGDDKSSFALIGLSLVCNLDEWIFYTKSTYQMCFFKELFSNLDEVHGGVVIYIYGGVISNKCL